MKPIAAVGIVAGIAVLGSVAIALLTGSSTAAPVPPIPPPNPGTPPANANASRTAFPGWQGGDPAVGGWYYKMTGDALHDSIQREIVRILCSDDAGNWKQWRQELYDGKHGEWAFDFTSAGFTVYSQAILYSNGGNQYDQWDKYAYPNIESVMNPANYPGIVHFLKFMLQTDAEIFKQMVPIAQDLLAAGA